MPNICPYLFLAVQALQQLEDNAGLSEEQILAKLRSFWLTKILWVFVLNMRFLMVCFCLMRYFLGMIWLFCTSLEYVTFWTVKLLDKQDFLLGTFVCHLAAAQFADALWVSKWMLCRWVHRTVMNCFWKSYHFAVQLHLTISSAVFPWCACARTQKTQHWF